MKIVCLIRHAKSSRDDPALKDIDRPLNARGKQQASWLGRRFQEFNQPEIIISSPAKRALTTAHVLAKGIGYPLNQIVINSAIYQFGPLAILKVIKNIAQDVGRAIVVGHNPDLSELMRYLSGEKLADLPTAGIVCLKFDVDSWQKIAMGTGQVEAQDSPSHIL